MISDEFSGHSSWIKGSQGVHMNSFGKWCVSPIVCKVPKQSDCLIYASSIVPIIVLWSSFGAWTDTVKSTHYALPRAAGRGGGTLFGTTVRNRNLCVLRHNSWYHLINSHFPFFSLLNLIAIMSKNIFTLRFILSTNNFWIIIVH